MAHHPYKPSKNSDSVDSKQAGRIRRAPGQGKPVIGLAGGVGSGKSLVAKQFKELGCAIIDADALAHEVLTQDDVRQTLVNWWGKKVLNKQGQIDRKAVGRCVFDAPNELVKLEQLVHPRVHALRDAQRQTYEKQQGVRAIVEDCPLLFEVGLEKQCDAVVFVATQRAVRLKRVKVNRGWSEVDLDSREKNQLGLDIKANRADYVVDNSEGEQQTFKQVRSILLNIIPDNSTSE